MICSIVFATSLIIFIWLGSPSELNSISAEWGKEEFNIGDVTEVKITPSPSDAKIESLELSENNIADLEYKDGKAVITFTGSGNASLFFTANGEIKSSSKTITVIDPEEEARIKPRKKNGLGWNRKLKQLNRRVSSKNRLRLLNRKGLHKSKLQRKQHKSRLHSKAKMTPSCI